MVGITSTLIAVKSLYYLISHQVIASIDRLSGGLNKGVNQVSNDNQGRMKVVGN